MGNCRALDWRTKIAFDQRLGRPDEIGIAPVTRPAPTANWVRSASQRRSGTAGHASGTREMVRRVCKARLPEGATFAANSAHLSDQTTWVSSDDEPTRTETTETGAPGARPQGRAVRRAERVRPGTGPEEKRLRKHHMQNFLEQASRLAEPVRDGLLDRLRDCLPKDAFSGGEPGISHASFWKDRQQAADLLLRTGTGPEELLDLTCSLIRENRGSRQAAPSGKPDRERFLNEQVLLLKGNLAQELALRIGACLAARADDRPSKDEIQRAICDALFGNGKIFRPFLEEHGIPRRLVEDAARAAVDNVPLVEELRRSAEAAASSDRKTLDGRRGGCAGAGGAVVNMARHGLVKGISSGLAYAVKEAVAVAFIELLGLSGLDFFWSGLMGNVAAMVYYGFGYDELRGLISDNLNACFLGSTYKQKRDQSLGRTTWGEFLTEGLPRIAFSPAGQGIMGATDVSSKNQLPLYVLSKICGKSMANFGAGFVQAGLRRAMPDTYRELPRDRRDFNALRTSRANLQSLNSRFSHERRFRSAPEVAMKIFVYELSYAITAGIFATLYPMAEEAAGYHSDAQARFLQTLVFNTISVGLMLVMLLGGRLLWKRCGPAEADASEIRDIENQLATDDAWQTEDGSLTTESTADSDEEEPASGGTDAPTDTSGLEGELWHILSALLDRRFADEGSEAALADPERLAGIEMLRTLLADEDGSLSDEDWETDGDDSFDGGGLSDEDV